MAKRPLRIEWWIDDLSPAVTVWLRVRYFADGTADLTEANNTIHTNYASGEAASAQVQTDPGRELFLALTWTPADGWKGDCHIVGLTPPDWPDWPVRGT